MLWPQGCAGSSPALGHSVRPRRARDPARPLRLSNRLTDDAVIRSPGPIASPAPAPPRAASTRTLRRPLPRPLAGNTRIVVAEDEALIRLDLVEMLREEGFDVVGEAGDGEQAVRWPRELQPDVVVLDVKMPRAGRDLPPPSTSARSGSRPVVMLTAFSQRELVERARDAGAMAYLVKPFTKADLLPAIEIARRRYAEMQALEAEVADLAERFETRKRVDRAKGVLMRSWG